MDWNDVIIMLSPGDYEWYLYSDKKDMYYPTGFMRGEVNEEEIREYFNTHKPTGDWVYDILV